MDQKVNKKTKETQDIEFQYTAELNIQTVEQHNKKGAKFHIWNKKKGRELLYSKKIRTPANRTKAKATSKSIRHKKTLQTLS